MTVATLDQIDHELASGFRWLRFADVLEKTYGREFARARIRLSLFWAFVGTFIYDLVFFGDVTMMHDVFPQLAFVRFCIFTPYAFIAVWLVRRRPTALNYDLLAISVCVLGGFLPMAASVESQSPYFFVYQNGNIATLLFFVIALQPRFPAIVLGLAALCAVHFTLIQMNGSLDAVTFSGVVTFFVTLAIFLALSAYFLERKDRLNFLNRMRGEWLQAELRQQSERDELTGLYNRRSLNRISKSVWAGPARAPVAVIMLDIDHFKLYNDVHGHVEGDACIRRVCACVAEQVSELGAAFRFGGEEILVLLPGSDAVTAQETAEQLRLAIEASAIPHSGLAEGGVVTASLGVSVASRGASSLEDLVRAADAALYDAKRGGRNMIAFRTPEPPGADQLQLAS
ncbi:diguanylate cyclase (GGDEF)-like protein [Rhizobium sp. SG_E_25_P2]|uniref:GGDEF domain-containing protein n=1 Tax=Rhizobium sp. SG_E_25_P2 TaxID=2879942 RepID=UPI0024762C71|nr:GGDEF domain-containing protein [Rhizobium sp. SG_E_25_P2]MDH6265256.1 diguanylate cyclase (GGDEF)-like protein [Rhizobium sp. SG_E_25_P2]